MELNTLSNLPLSSSKKPENQDTDEWFSRTTALDVEMFVFFFLTAVKAWLRVLFYT